MAKEEHDGTLSEMVLEEQAEVLDTPQDELESVPDDWDVVHTSGQAIKRPGTEDEVFSLNPGVMSHMVVAVVALVVGVLIGMVAFGGNDGITESQLRIILNEALANSSAGGGQTVNYMADDDPFLGPSDAPVVVVEFSDFLCSFCGRHFQQTLTPLIEQYDGYIRYVYRDFPGVGGQYAVQSALAAECAYDQDRFWDYHALLFNNQDSLRTDNIGSVLTGYAEQLGLDMATFTPCYEEQEHYNDILLDRTDGESVGARGTPAFLINGRFISGAQPIETFRAIIDDELEKQGITPPEA